MKGKAIKEFQFHGTVEGIITQFREILKPQPVDFIGKTPYKDIGKKEDGFTNFAPIKPRYKVGETVYIKEPYYNVQHCGSVPAHMLYRLRGDGLPLNPDIDGWKSALFMPAKYARYFIEITAVRCERVNNISDAECFAEGIEEFDGYNVVQYGKDYSFCEQCGGTRLYNSIGAGLGVIFDCDCMICADRDTFGVDCEKFTIIRDNPQQAYAALFDSINGKGAWKQNPYVFVYSYKLIK